MLKNTIKKTFAIALAITLFSINSGVANAAVPNNIGLYYTQGAPSSATCLSNSFSFYSYGNSYATLNISTFTASGPYIRIVTSPYTLSSQYYYGTTSGYVDVPYTNGRPAIGSYISTNVTLNNYSNSTSVSVYGIIIDAAG